LSQEGLVVGSKAARARDLKDVDLWDEVEGQRVGEDFVGAFEHLRVAALHAADLGLGCGVRLDALLVAPSKKKEKKKGK
jgi:hypothetical protein